MNAVAHAFTAAPGTPDWPDFDNVLQLLRMALDNSATPVTVPAIKEIIDALHRLLDGQDATLVVPFFGAAALSMQRQLQTLTTDARQVALAYATLPADESARFAKLKTQAGTDEDALRAAILAEQEALAEAREELVSTWLARGAAAIHSLMTETAQRRAEREEIVREASVLYAKLRKQTLPQVTELRETLRKLCDAMKRSGQGFDAAHISATYIDALERLEGVLTRLTPPQPKQRKD